MLELTEFGKKVVSFWSERFSQYRVTLSPESVYRRIKRYERAGFCLSETTRGLVCHPKSEASLSRFWCDTAYGGFGVPVLWIFFPYTVVEQKCDKNLSKLRSLTSTKPLTNYNLRTLFSVQYFLKKFNYMYNLDSIINYAYTQIQVII